MLVVKGKVVLVTGAASGIGKQIGMNFLKDGAIVVFCDINDEKVQSLNRLLKETGDSGLALQCDVTKEEEIEALVQKILTTYGRIDVLINNAGLQHVASIEDFPAEKFEYMIQVMLVAPFIMTKLVLPHMKQQRFGRIINISSINGVIGFAGKAGYNSAKHGLIGLTKVTALEAAEYGITVNALCPGYVDTPLVRGQFEDLAKNRNIPVEQVLEEVLYPLVPQKRLLDIQEIADYALFLASDGAKGVTGQSVVIDGGYTAQ